MRVGLYGDLTSPTPRCLMGPGPRWFISMTGGVRTQIHVVGVREGGPGGCGRTGLSCTNPKDWVAECQTRGVGKPGRLLRGCLADGWDRTNNLAFFVLLCTLFLCDIYLSSVWSGRWPVCTHKQLLLIPVRFNGVHFFCLSHDCDFELVTANTLRTDRC